MIEIVLNQGEQTLLLELKKHNRFPYSESSPLANRLVAEGLASWRQESGKPVELQITDEGRHVVPTPEPKARAKLSIATAVTPSPEEKPE